MRLHCQFGKQNAGAGLEDADHVRRGLERREASVDLVGGKRFERQAMRLGAETGAAGDRALRRADH